MRCQTTRNKVIKMPMITIRTGSSVAEQLTADQRVTGSIPVQSFFLFFFKFLTMRVFSSDVDHLHGLY